MIGLVAQHHIPVDKQRMKWFGMWRERTTTSSQSKHTTLVDTLMSGYKASGLQRKTTGWGGLNEISYREAPSRGPTPYSYIYHFWQKTYPFWIFSIKRWYLFNIPGLEDCNSSNCCKCTVYITGSLEIRKHCCLFYIHEMRRLAPLGPFTDQNDRFSYPVIYFN